jgi:Ca-activated chloride channel family protein
VKIEEMINYFSYDYPQPTGKHPFAIHTDVAATPWNKDTRLVKIALQGKTVPLDEVPASNLVFLLDVSGSMNSPNKLPLLKSAFKLLTNQLREQDKVAIVVYAGAAGVVLNSTNGDHKQVIFEALNNLSAGGSTAGGEGIDLAYKIAQENFINGGNNRVILATDGDFNVGASSDRAMGDLIEEKRETGIFLTALGFGMGNYQDSKLETLAQKRQWESCLHRHHAGSKKSVGNRIRRYDLYHSKRCQDPGGI